MPLLFSPITPDSIARIAYYPSASLNAWSHGGSVCSSLVMMKILILLDSSLIHSNIYVEIKSATKMVCATRRIRVGDTSDAGGH